MFIQLLNIVAGFVLAWPKLREWYTHKHLEELSGKIEPYRGTVGLIALIAGVAALLERLSILSIGDIGASFPQAAVALAMGALLAPHLLENVPPVHEYAKKLEPYAEWIGIAGILVGLGSLTIGCVSPICYPM